jgi:hypothetical protein
MFTGAKHFISYKDYMCKETIPGEGILPHVISSVLCMWCKLVLSNHP